MPTDLTKANLLLVEDSEDDAYFFRRTLQKSRLECVVHHSTNGAEAIDYLQKISASDPEAIPRVMFLDLKMPVLNGFEVLDWLRNQDFAGKMQVIVLSGSEHQSDKERAARLGAKDYLIKPVTTVDLHRFLQGVCPVTAETGAGL